MVAISAASVALAPGAAVTPAPAVAVGAAVGWGVDVGRAEAVGCGVTVGISAGSDPHPANNSINPNSTLAKFIVNLSLGRTVLCRHFVVCIPQLIVYRQPNNCQTFQL